MKIKNSNVIFSTGKEAYAHCGIIGIDSDLNVFEGYDGHFEEIHPPPHFNRELDLTEEEVQELCDYMINLWEKLKNQ